MTNLDTRQVTRDSLFLLAQVRIGGQEDVTRVKVRNLSAGGMMAEAPAKVVRGSRIAVELRNIGWVEGTVAWKQGDRFGIAFVDEIDPTLVRAPAESVRQGDLRGSQLYAQLPSRAGLAAARRPPAQDLTRKGPGSLARQWVQPGPIMV